MLVLQSPSSKSILAIAIEVITVVSCHSPVPHHKLSESYCKFIINEGLSMNRWVFFFVVVCLLSAIIGFGIQYANRYRRQQEVKSGLEKLIDQLPEAENFDVVNIVRQEFSSSAYGITCYYARAYVIVGTPLSEVEALDSYTEKLHLQGWLPEGKQYETAKVVHRGVHDRVVVSSVKPDLIDNAIDYTQLKGTYRSVIFIGLDYMFPSRDAC